MADAETSARDSISGKLKTQRKTREAPEWHPMNALQRAIWSLSLKVLINPQYRNNRMMSGKPTYQELGNS